MICLAFLLEDFNSVVVLIEPYQQQQIHNLKESGRHYNGGLNYSDEIDFEKYLSSYEDFLYNRLLWNNGDRLFTLLGTVPVAELDNLVKEIKKLDWSK